MKKSLFDKQVTDEVIERSRRLTEATPAQWGTMNAAEMLHHCGKALQLTLQQQQAGNPSTLKQKISCFAILNIIPRIPRGARAPKLLDVKRSKLSVLSLNHELQFFESSVNEFQSFEGSILSTHPYFGRLTRKQWGIVSWMHMDHHLRQFGV